MEHYEINIVDQYKNRGDSFGKKRKNQSHKRILDDIENRGYNYVTTTMTDLETGETKLVNKTNNLVVFRGRSTALARVFGKPLTHGLNDTNPIYDETNTNNTPNRFICWMGAGNGGATTENNQTPLAVGIEEFDITNYIDLTADTGAPNDNIIRLTNDSNKTYHKFDPGYPRFIPETNLVEDTSLYGSLDTGNQITISDTSYKRDAFLISHVRMTLSGHEANGSTGSQEINELGLFFGPDDSVSGDQTWNPLEMYAKITMPTITKLKTRSFAFNWFIYF